MLNPYKVIEESDTSITYQYNSLYSWALVVILILLITGAYIASFLLQALAAVLIVLYFGVKLIIGNEVTSKVRQALKSGSVELSGGKYSLSNPLKVKIPKNA